METKRLYYIDWLRVLVVLALIPFHASLTYLRYGVVYIKEPVSGLASLPFLIIEVPLGDFFMTLMFFVSGVASYYSFQIRGTGSYIGERAQKLALPLGLGYLLLCPVTAYIQALYEGFQEGFLSFLPRFYWYDTFHYHGYGHLWFLFYLFVFSVICVPLFNRWQRDEGRVERIGAFFSKGNRLLLPAGFIVLLEVCLRQRFNTGAYVIVGDWANVSVYLSLFLFGYVYAADPRIQEKVKEYYKLSIVFGILGLATLYFVNINSQMFWSDAPYLGVLWVWGKGIYECAGIIFLLNFGRLYLNRKSNVLGYLNRGSFTIYIFHFLPVNFFTWIFIRLQMPIFAKYLLVVALSYLTVFCICELWQRAKSKIKHEAIKASIL
jgi:glucans biosynthesis protein C